MSKTYNSFNMLVGNPCLAWNASLLDEPERGEMVKQGVNLFKDKTDANGMIERKLLLFPNDRRHVVKFDVTETKDSFRFFVISLDQSG